MKLIDITVSVLQETEKAYRVSDGSTTDWVPKSQVELSPIGPDGGRDNICECTMPEWMAKEKGFI